MLKIRHGKHGVPFGKIFNYIGNIQKKYHLMHFIMVKLIDFLIFVSLPTSNIIPTNKS